MDDLVQVCSRWASRDSTVFDGRISSPARNLDDKIAIFVLVSKFISFASKTAAFVRSVSAKALINASLTPGLLIIHDFDRETARETEDCEQRVIRFTLASGDRESSVV
jgi:hypothetical protein